MRATVIRKAHFNAAHRLYNPSWSFEKNDRIFGKCNNVHYHGHNYDLEVMVTGEVDQETGFVINLAELKEIIKIEVTEYLDHKNLNEQILEFKELIPTAEHICFVIYNRLRVVLDQKYDLKIRLFETARNIVEYPPIS